MILYQKSSTQDHSLQKAFVQATYSNPEDQYQKATNYSGPAPESHFFLSIHFEKGNIHKWK